MDPERGEDDPEGVKGGVEAGGIITDGEPSVIGLTGPISNEEPLE